MKKAKIYIPNKSAMQSGLGKLDKWILEFETNDPTKNPLMGWESSNDTYTELKLEFSTKELAINYAKKKKIDSIKKLQNAPNSEKKVSFFIEEINDLMFSFKNSSNVASIFIFKQRNC